MNDFPVTNAGQKLSHLYFQAEYFVVAIILFLLTWYFHGSAFNGFWRFHDGMHILFALTHSPWQYFFDPVTITDQSTHLTPWNVLFYDINLSLFGLIPKWHYAHLILLIWGGCFMTFILLRIQLSSFFSLFGAVFFLLGLPTTESVQQLMNGHYLTGLIFIQISLYLYILSLNKNNNMALAISGAFFYLLATTCKEVYVPLIIILPFLPIKTFRERIISFWPYCFAAIIYIVWRLIMVQTFIGGYSPNLEALDVINISKQFFQIPMILFGSKWYSYVVLIGVAYLLVRAIIRQQISLLLILVSLLALLSPLAPLTIYPGLDSGNNRYFFFLWWAVCILLAFLLSNNKTDKETFFMLIAAFVFAMAIAVHSSSYKNKYLNDFILYNEQLYQFVLEQPTGFLLIEGKLANYWNRVLNSAIQAYKISYNNSQTFVKLVDLHEIFELKNHNSNIDVFQYSAKRKRVENINKILPIKFDRLRKKFVKDINLSVFIHYDGKTLKWLFGPFTDGIYKIIYTDGKGEYGSFISRHQGAINFSGAKSINFYLYYTSPEGWIARSPKLFYDPASNPTIKWKGSSVIP